MSMIATLLSLRAAKTLFTFFATTTPFGPEPTSTVFTYFAVGLATSKMSMPLSPRSVTYIRWACWSMSMMSIDAVFPAIGGIGILDTVTQPLVFSGISGRRVGAAVPAPGATVGATVGAGQLVAAAVGAATVGALVVGAAAGPAQAEVTATTAERARKDTNEGRADMETSHRDENAVANLRPGRQASPRAPVRPRRAPHARRR